MSIVPPPVLNTIFRYVDANKALYVKGLREAVAIQSVSSRTEKWPEVNRMVRWTEERFRKLGAKTEVVNVGQRRVDGKVLELPVVLLATLGKEANKKTICLYVHVDVMDADPKEGWRTDPWDVVEQDGRLYGRGTVDNKGVLMCWLYAIEVFQNNRVPLPVNLRIIVDGCQEMGSPGLEQLFYTKRKTFFTDIDHICACDSFWLGNKIPCVTYGLRGHCSFEIDVTGPKHDLHSGEFGGNVAEPMLDLIFLLNALQDQHGRPCIPGLMEGVNQVTPIEESLYDPITFDVTEFRERLGARRLRFGEEKALVLMNRWRFPALSFHSVQSGYEDAARLETVIPRRARGSFTVRLVPDQTPEEVQQLVEEYVDSVWSLRNSPNTMKLSLTSAASAWLKDPCAPNYIAARKAMRLVYRTEPDLIREGASMQHVSLLERACSCEAVLLPLFPVTGNVHQANENCPVKNYVFGIKVLAAYMYEIAQQQQQTQPSQKRK